MDIPKIEQNLDDIPEAIATQENIITNLTHDANLTRINIDMEKAGAIEDHKNGTVKAQEAAIILATYKNKLLLLEQEKEISLATTICDKLLRMFEATKYHANLVRREF